MPCDLRRPGSTGDVRLQVSGEPPAVRAVLAELMAAPLLRTLAEDDRSTAELVLAEVLNNVVEHAFAGGRGQIDIVVSVGPEGLGFHVVDDGAPMPDDRAPDGRPPDPAALPEGGWGWYLIRSLTCRLAYRREPGRNCLCFVLPASSPRG